MRPEEETEEETEEEQDEDEYKSEDLSVWFVWFFLEWGRIIALQYCISLCQTPT